MITTFVFFKQYSIETMSNRILSGLQSPKRSSSNSRKSLKSNVVRQEISSLRDENKQLKNVNVMLKKQNETLQTENMELKKKASKLHPLKDSTQEEWNSTRRFLNNKTEKERRMYMINFLLNKYEKKDIEGTNLGNTTEEATEMLTKMNFDDLSRLYFLNSRNKYSIWGENDKFNLPGFGKQKRLSKKKGKSKNSKKHSSKRK